MLYGRGSRLYTRKLQDRLGGRFPFQRWELDRLEEIREENDFDAFEAKRAFRARRGTGPVVGDLFYLPPARTPKYSIFQCNARPDGFDSRNAQRMMGKWFTINGCISALAILLPACEPRQAQSVFTLLSPNRTGIHFQNTITENDSVNLIMNEYVYNGGGVAAGDVNNDGLADLYFSGNQVPGRLYLNKGNLRFEDITEKAGVTPRGWATGVNLVDINADGYLDLYVCVSGVHASGQRANQLYLNNKDLTFTESAEAYGLADTGYATQAAFLDYDRDGDLDLYLLNHKLAQENPNAIRPRQVNGENGNTDKLYRNEGPQKGPPRVPGRVAGGRHHHRRLRPGRGRE
jgi:hypothetical protein